MFSPTSPITGGSQTGFTSPTYTFVWDEPPPSVNGKQFAVTGIGGTQTGVTVHSASAPFTVALSRPQAYKSPTVNASGNVVASGNNTLKLIVRKAVTPYQGALPRTMTWVLPLSIPVGADTYDSANIRAAFSCLIGLLSQISAGLGDTAVTGLIGD